MLSDSEAAELLSFLTPDTRPDVKGQATEYILGLSGNRQEDDDNGDGDDDTVDNVVLNSCTNYRLFPELDQSRASSNSYLLQF